MARAAAKRNKSAKQAARSARQVGTPERARRRPEYEQQLFFGRIRGQAKWVFALLAVVFAGSFVFLGVGSGTSGLSDILNGKIHLFGSGDSSTSVKNLQKKVSEHPRDLKARLDLAQALDRDGRIDESIAAFRGYLKIKPGNVDGLNLLAVEYGKKMQDLSAKSQAAQNAPLQDSSVFSTVWPLIFGPVIGGALSQLQDPHLSAGALQQGHYAEIAARLQAASNARTDVYRQLAAAQPDDPNALFQLAFAAQQVGDTQTAIDAYTKFLKRFPDDASAVDARQQIKKLQNPSSATPNAPVGTG